MQFVRLQKNVGASYPLDPQAWGRDARGTLPVVDVIIHSFVVMSEHEQSIIQGQLYLTRMCTRCKTGARSVWSLNIGLVFLLSSRGLLKKCLTNAWKQLRNLRSSNALRFSIQSVFYVNLTTRILYYHFLVMSKMEKKE